MSTQLRLVEAPEPRPQTARRPAKAAPKAATRRGRITGPARSSRRSASWGDWRLDAGTRQVGRAGVANARRALEAVLESAPDGELRAS